MKRIAVPFFALITILLPIRLNAQDPLANKVTIQKMSNYLFIQKEQMEELIHRNVLNGNVKAYSSVQFTKPYKKEEVAALGGVFETIQYSPSPNDPYAYRDTLLLTPFNTERIVAWKFTRINELTPFAVSNILSLTFYYRNTDTSSVVLYHVPFNSVWTLLKQTNQILVEFITEQMPPDGIIKNEDWNTAANKLFKNITSEMLIKAQQGKVDCFTDKELINDIFSRDWPAIVNFNYVRRGENGQNTPKSFESTDIEYISTYEISEQQDSVTLIVNKSVGIGHFLVITGVDRVERQLLWVSYSSLPKLLSKKRDLLLAHVLYYHRLQLLDGNKTYTSNYFINSAKE